MTTTTRHPSLRSSAIAASLDTSKELTPETAPPATVAVMHLGHPTDAQYGQVEYLTPAEYERFVWLHTWPRPKGAQG